MAIDFANENHSHILLSMHVTVLSSLSLFARDDAAQLLTGHLAERYGAVTRVHYDDRTEGEGKVFYRIHQTLEGESASTAREVRLGEAEDCTSCFIRADLDALLSENAYDRGACLLVLPTGVSTSVVMGLANHHSHLAVESACLACIGAELEDDLWSSETLSSQGSSSCSDERSLGEFFAAELAYADTCVLTRHPLACHEPSQDERGREILAHIEPHLTVFRSDIGASSGCGCHSFTAVSARSVPGALHLPESLQTPGNSSEGTSETASATPEEPAVRRSSTTTGHFTTVLLTSPHLIDAQALGQHLPAIVQGAVRVRGHIWLSSHYDERVAVEGIGPTVWLQTHRPWAEEPSTSIAITGEDLDPAELQDLLNRCTIDGDDIARHLLQETNPR